MIRRFQVPALFFVCLIFGAVCVRAVDLIAPAIAEQIPLDAGVPFAKALETGQPAPVTPSVPAIHDPVAQPAVAFDELKAARKIGWPVAALVGLTMLLLAVGHLGVAWLKTGARAFALAALTTGCLAAGNAALSGGTWVAVVTTGVLAAAAMWQADRTKAAAEKAAKAARP